MAQSIEKAWSFKFGFFSWLFPLRTSLCHDCSYWVPLHMVLRGSCDALHRHTMRYGDVVITSVYTRLAATLP